MIRQKAVRGVVRARLSAAAAAEIEGKIVGLAVRFDCSKSFIIAVALAQALGVTIPEAEMFRALVARPRPFRLHKRKKAA